MKRLNKYFLVGFIAGIAIVEVTPASADTSFVAASKEAARCYKSPGGDAYSKKILPKVTALAKDVMGYESCFSLSKDSSCEVVLIISKTGSIQQVVPQPNNRIAACVAPRLKRYRFPPPPTGTWYQVVTFNRKIEYISH